MWGAQSLLWGLQVVIRVDGEGPQVLLYTTYALLCLSVAGFVSTWLIHVEYDSRGATFRWGRLRWGHLSWTDVLKIVPAHLSTGGLDVRTVKNDRTLSARPNEAQLEQLHDWHAAAQETRETDRGPKTLETGE